MSLNPKCPDGLRHDLAEFVEKMQSCGVVMTCNLIANEQTPSGQPIANEQTRPMGYQEAQKWVAQQQHLVNAVLLLLHHMYAVYALAWNDIAAAYTALNYKQGTQPTDEQQLVIDADNCSVAFFDVYCQCLKDAFASQKNVEKVKSLLAVIDQETQKEQDAEKKLQKIKKKIEMKERMIKICQDCFLFETDACQGDALELDDVYDFYRMIAEQMLKKLNNMRDDMDDAHQENQAATKKKQEAIDELSYIEEILGIAML